MFLHLIVLWGWQWNSHLWFKHKILKKIKKWKWSIIHHKLTNFINLFKIYYFIGSCFLYIDVMYDVYIFLMQDIHMQKMWTCEKKKIHTIFIIKLWDEIFYDVCFWSRLECMCSNCFYFRKSATASSFIICFCNMFLIEVWQSSSSSCALYCKLQSL